MQNASIMTRLREQTAEAHKNAEEHALERALVAGSVSRVLYAQYLGQRYLVHKALEAVVREVCAADARFKGLIPESLMQEGNLEADLKHLGLRAADVEPCDATRALIEDIERTATETPAGVLGHYYVFEGSKNGARFIARALIGSLGLRPGPGLLYLDPHGEAQRPLWMEFKQRMDALALTGAERDAMVSAAQRTFTAVRAIDDELYSGQFEGDLQPAGR